MNAKFLHIFKMVETKTQLCKKKLNIEDDFTICINCPLI